MTSKLLREPLLYFLLAGGALFLIGNVLGDDGQDRIVVSEAEQARLAAQWQAQMGRPPSDAELAALTDQWIREEIYYREAKAMGLDQDDVIIRRRLAQKLTFLTEDLIAGEDAAETTLRSYYAAHGERYTEPQRFTFAHRYFSAERRDDAEGEARRALQAAGVDDPSPGDPFMLQSSYVDRSQREIGELFGREFAAALVALPEGTWQGPIRSAYGWHLVRIDARRPPRQREFESVADQVAADYRQDERRRANEELYASLRTRYQVVRP